VRQGAVTVVHKRREPHSTFLIAGTVTKDLDWKLPETVQELELSVRVSTGYYLYTK